MEKFDIESLNNDSFESGLENVNNFFKSSSLDNLKLYYSKKENPFESDFYNFQEESQEIENIVKELDEAILLDIDTYTSHSNECEEILNILKKPIHKKNRHNGNNLFKPLRQPKKISLRGRVLSDTPSNETQSSSGQNSPDTLSMA